MHKDRPVGWLLLIGVFIISISVYIKLYSPTQNIALDKTFELGSIDEELFDKKSLDKVLKRAYYFNQDPIQFTSNFLNKFNPEYYNYNMYYTLMMNDLRGIKVDIKGYKNNMSSLKINNKKDEISEIYYITGIYKYMNFNDYDKNKLMSILLNHYDENEGLFFVNKKEDDIESKLGITLDVINSFGNMKEPIKYKDDILKKCITRFNDDKYFDTKNPIESLNTAGLNIMILHKLGYKFIDLGDKVKDRREWLKQVNSMICSTQENDQFYVIYVENLIYINKFFNTQFAVSKKLLDKSIEADGKYVIEPVITSSCLNVYKNFGYSFPYQNEVDKYIRDSVQCGFNKIGYVSPYLRDNYYGLVLAKKINFNYDKEAMKKYLKYCFTTNIEEDSSIYDGDKLSEVYYLLLSMKVLELKVTDGNIIINSVTSYLTSLDISNEKQYSKFIDDYYTGIRLIHLLNGDISDNLKKKTIELINNIDSNQQIYSDDRVYKFYRIMDGVNLNEKNADKIFKHTDDALSKLYIIGGYKKAEDPENPDLDASYEVYLIKKEKKLITDKQREEIKKYFYSTMKKDSIMGYKWYMDIDLETIYKACALTSLYNGVSE